MTGESEAAVFFHQVRPDEDGKMVQQVLRNRFRFSRRMFRRLKQQRAVEVNGGTVFLTSRVKAGDVIRVRMPEEEKESVSPEPVPIQVVYEDEDVILLDKPPGLVVHPTKGVYSGTLANGLVHYWKERGEDRAVRPVTRLDKDTSGLILFAKHPYAHAFLAEQMERKRYRRDYLALVHGRMKGEGGIIDAPIGRDEQHPTRREVRSDGAHAVTHYRVLQRWQNATLLRLSLETGRTHQIRVHLAYLGYPIIGDALYGGERSDFPIERQALHAAYLKLFHPRERREVEWSSPLPADMERVLHFLEDH
ncbi:pseudouridine synthase [Marinithermofilum abyssi]|uniref:Pseudouridine synthase n=1 Tax=Marinithermofilum abyssi TaxID=1571185 RepID=A0A8J2VCK4_9BACL|nr:RluA family pseudouridine synthase [Marinithermofilum abyssi]GGE09622.1 pseudouridine synthase [Marinithermofilum abyssi]